MKVLDPGFRRCERIGANVRIDRTEGECRDAHGCLEGRCPLESEFGNDGVSIRSRALAAALAGWCVFPPGRAT
jgi:hypothetical protein